MTFADVQTPSNLEFGVFIGCVVALMAIIQLTLSVIQKSKELFFTKQEPPEQRPVTEKEFESRLNLLRVEMQQIKVELMTVISAPNLRYVSQDQFETKMERMKEEINDKIDKGGEYAHDREHRMSQDLQAVQLQLARITGMMDRKQRGPINTVQEESA